ncbi:hypothetical protein ABZP36_004478 [Zizania latifolia]
MARSSLQSQSSVGAGAGGGTRPATIEPRGTPTAEAGMRLCRVSASNGGGASPAAGGATCCASTPMRRQACSDLFSGL